MWHKTEESHQTLSMLLLFLWKGKSQLLGIYPLKGKHSILAQAPKQIGMILLMWRENNLCSLICALLTHYELMPRCPVPSNFNGNEAQHESLRYKCESITIWPVKLLKLSLTFKSERGDRKKEFWEVLWIFWGLSQ